MAYIIQNLEQRSTEWKNFRKGKIGASQIAAIMGVDPWKTPLQLWEDMIFERETEVTPAMQRGIDREQEALDWFNTFNSSSFKPAVLQSKEYPWMIASLDGFSKFSSPIHFPEILEIKWTNRASHGLAKKGCIPTYYIPQVRFQMYISGASRVYYLSCFEDDKVVVTIWPDQDYVEAMIPQVLAFRQRLIDFKPPEATDCDRVAIVDSSLSAKGQRYQQLDRLILELQIEQDQIRKDLLANAHHPRVSIDNLNLSRIIRKGNIDYESIPELKNVNLEQYRKKPIETWRINYE